MKKKLLLILVSVFYSIAVRSQSVLYSESFTSSLGTCTATNSSGGAWAWSNNCSQSTAGGHTGPGHAMFQGSGCQFGNGSSTVSGSLVTPTVLVSPSGGTLNFNYFIQNECAGSSVDCTYDVLSVEISNNGGTSYTTVLNSDFSPGGIGNTVQWTSVAYNLSAYAGQTIRVRFNFNSIDGIGNAFDGIYVDDINIIGCKIDIYATANNATVSPALCSGNSLTLTTNAISNYSWSTNVTTSSIVVTPSVNTSYTLSAMSPSNCMALSIVNVTVSGSAPNLSITASSTNVCVGKTVTLTATGANSHVWTGSVTNGVAFSPTVSNIYTVTGANGCGTVTATANIIVAPLNVVVASTHTSVCTNQTATLSVNAAATSFTWEPVSVINSNSLLIVTPSVNTIYTVSVTDGTCSGSGTINLNANQAPTIVPAASNVTICPGESTNLSASGGVNYTWTPVNLTGSMIAVSPSITTLYTLVGDALNGCSSSTTQVIIVAPTPVLSVTGTSNTICKGETATLSISGATTYVWSDGNTGSVNIVSPTQTTVYTIVGTDAAFGCTETVVFNLTVNSPTLNFTGNTTICSGISTNISVNGASTYTWTHDASTFSTIAVSPNTTTTYSVNAISSINGLNCPVFGSVEITVNPKPTIDAVPTKTALCPKQTNTLTASGADTYTWISTTSAPVVAPTITISSVNAAVLMYTLTGVSSLGCETSKSIFFQVSPCLGINELNEKIYNLSIYPNPNNGSFTISGLELSTLVLLNQLGQVVRTINLNATNNYSSYVSDLSNGVYFITNNSMTQKIIVHK